MRNPPLMWTKTVNSGLPTNLDLGSAEVDSDTVWTHMWKQVNLKSLHKLEVLYSAEHSG